MRDFISPSLVLLSRCKRKRIQNFDVIFGSHFVFFSCNQLFSICVFLLFCCCRDKEKFDFYSWGWERKSVSLQAFSFKVLSVSSFLLFDALYCFLGCKENAESVTSFVD
jgi:hypothetical protein